MLTRITGSKTTGSCRGRKRVLLQHSVKFRKSWFVVTGSLQWIGFVQMDGGDEVQVGDERRCGFGFQCALLQPR